MQQAVQPDEKKKKKETFIYVLCIKIITISLEYTNEGEK